jgi:hypothetical protein
MAIVMRFQTRLVARPLASYQQSQAWAGTPDSGLNPAQVNRWTARAEALQRPWHPPLPQDALPYHHLHLGSARYPGKVAGAVGVPANQQAEDVVRCDMVTADEAAPLRLMVSSCHRSPLTILPFSSLQTLYSFSSASYRTWKCTPRPP